MSQQTSSAPEESGGGKKPRPAHEVRYGSVKAVIWRNQTQSGPMFNVTCARLYKDGNEWRESSSFGRDDLLVLVEAVKNAWAWIHTQA